MRELRFPVIRDMKVRVTSSIHVFRSIALMNRHANSADSLKSPVEHLQQTLAQARRPISRLLCALRDTWATRAIRYLSDLCCFVPSITGCICLVYCKYFVDIPVAYNVRFWVLTTQCSWR